MVGKTFEAGRRGKIKCVFDDDGQLISRSREAGITEVIVCMALDQPQVTGAVDADCPWFDRLKCGPCPDKISREAGVIIQGLAGTTASVVDDISNGVI